MYSIETVKKLQEVLESVAEEYKEFLKLLRQQSKGSQDLLETARLFQRHCLLPGNLVVSLVFVPNGLAVEVCIQEFGDLLHQSLFKHGMLFLSKRIPCGEEEVTSTSLPSAAVYAQLYGFSSTPAAKHKPAAAGNASESFTYLNDIVLPVSVTSFRSVGAAMSAALPVLGGVQEFHPSSHKRVAYVDTACLHPLSSGEIRRLISAVHVAGLAQPGNPLLLFKCDEQKPGQQCWFVSTGFCDSAAPDILRRRLGMKWKQSLEEALRQSAVEESTYKAKFVVVGHQKNSPGTSAKGAHDEGLDISVEFLWRSASDFKHDQAPPPSAKALVNISVKAGPENSLLRKVYEELVVLDNAANSIVPDESSSLMQSFVSPEDLQSFKDTLSAAPLLDADEEIRKRTVRAHESDEDGPSVAQLMEESLRRNDHDFTDRLWLFLRNTRGMADLRYCVDDILSDVVNGALQPAIGASNETKLAKYIRKMYVADVEESKSSAREKILEFLSSDKAMLNLLYEIGFEKMRKDYFNFFLSQELATDSQLQGLAKKEALSIDISMLWKLHYCLEIITSSHFYLNLSLEYQRSLLKAAMEYYSGHPVDDWSPQFVLSILPFHDESVDLHARCTGRLPVSWLKVNSDDPAGGDLYAVCVETNPSDLSSLDSTLPDAGISDSNVFVVSGSVAKALKLI